MPRARKPQPQPLETFTFRDHQRRICIAEVWEQYPNIGARGAHKRKTRSEVFDKALVWISDQYYFSFSKHRQEVTKRSLYNPRFNRELMSEIRKVCAANKICVGRSTLYEVARDVKKAIKALDNAIKRYRPRTSITGEPAAS